MRSEANAPLGISGLQRNSDPTLQNVLGLSSGHMSCHRGSRRKAWYTLLIAGLNVEEDKDAEVSYFGVFVVAGGGSGKATCSKKSI